MVRSDQVKRRFYEEHRIFDRMNVKFKRRTSKSAVSRSSLLPKAKAAAADFILSPQRLHIPCVWRYRLNRSKILGLRSKCSSCRSHLRCPAFLPVSVHLLRKWFLMNTLLQASLHSVLISRPFLRFYDIISANKG